MTKYSDLEYLKLTKIQRFFYGIARFFLGIPNWFKQLGLKIWHSLKKFGIWLYNDIKDIFMTFKNGDWKTRVSYVVMGFGSCARGQWLRGILFFLLEAVFIFYMIFAGAGWLALMPTLGVKGPENNIYNKACDCYTVKYNDNSFKILLYSILTLFFIVAVIYTWRLNIKQNKISEEILATGKPLKSGKDDIRSLIDDQFHKTLLALPSLGILVFTVLPIVFMVLVAFTNYNSAQNNGYSNALFTWTGWAAFGEILNFSSGDATYSIAFGEVLTWTLIWAFFATFSNYFLGMLVAIMINKKGIRLKKMWRTILVLTIAIPQFISLLYVSKMFADNGFIISALRGLGWVNESFSFIGTKANPHVARITIIIINIWIGIPYLMLITSGILMNIPADLYESARIDGANIWQQYTKITMPYILFVTGPYLLTSFIGNMNNFNVIYLLTSGGPTNAALSSAQGSVGYTDLLVTWLFKLTTTGDGKYYLASVIGIMVFLVSAVLSLIVYNIMPSNKHEEDYQM